MKNALKFCVFLVNVAVAMICGQSRPEEGEFTCPQVIVTMDCNLHVTYQEILDNLTCGSPIPVDKMGALETVPQLSSSVLTNIVSPVLILMFDPDAPVGDSPTAGFFHWIALAQVGDDGDVEVAETILKYVAPSPPAGDGFHRYQIYLFTAPETASTTAGNQGRLGDLCSFISVNSLDPPLASFQFRFEKT